MQKYILYLKITDIYIRDSKDDSLTDNKTTFLSPLLAKKKTLQNYRDEYVSHVTKEM